MPCNRYLRIQTLHDAVLYIGRCVKYVQFTQQGSSTRSGIYIHHVQPCQLSLINTYRQDVPLFIGGETLYSQEGATQGDPLAMAMYAPAISPLINELKDADLDTKQVWYADDASAGAKLAHLLLLWGLTH